MAKKTDFEGYLYFSVDRKLTNEEIEKIEKEVSYARTNKLSESDKKEFKDIIIEMQECTVLDYTQQDKDRNFEVNVFANTKNRAIFEKFLHKITSKETYVFNLEVLEEF